MVDQFSKTETVALKLLQPCTLWLSTMPQIAFQHFIQMSMGLSEVHTSSCSCLISWIFQEVANQSSRFICDLIVLIGHTEYSAALTEGLASALECFKDLVNIRDPGLSAQKNCILICSSPPYNIPVLDVQSYKGFHVEQLASLMHENNIQLSVISPRRIQTWVTLFEEAIEKS